MSPIRVAVADDSSFVRRAIRRLLSDEPRLEVVGTAASGEELLAQLGRWRPDVITLDLAMPGMGGLPTLDRIMLQCPTPVIILSTHSGQGAPQTIEALHRGAVDFIDKQRYSLVDFQALREVLVEKILQVTAAHAKAPPAPPRTEPVAETSGREAEGSFDLVVVGASTGGPPAIQRLLEDLGRDLPVPVMVAQHMPEGFTRAFASRLNSHLALAVREVVDGEVLLPGTVYIGPAGSHVTLSQKAEGPLRAEVRRDVPVLSRRSESGIQHRPSVDLLFRSAARVLGARVVAVLLTGMGRDGAEGLADLRAAGAFTMAQDETTSVVHGMPGAAVALGAPRVVLPLEKIGGRIQALLANERRG